MKNRSVICLFIVLFSLSINLYSQVENEDDFTDLFIINSVSNDDNSLVLVNTTVGNGWRSIVYGYFIRNERNDYRLFKLWDKSGIPGTVRSLVYSPYSKNFYFTVAWNDGEIDNNNSYQGIYTVISKYKKYPYDIKVNYQSLFVGIDHLLVNKKGVWLLRDVPQWTLEDSEKVPGYDFSWSFSKLTQVEDEHGFYLMNEPKNSEQIKGMAFWRIENIPGEYTEEGTDPAGNAKYIIQTTDYSLLIRDIDNTSWWCYNCDTKTASKYSTLKKAKEVALDYDNLIAKKVYRKEHHFYFNLILIIVSGVLIIFFIVLILTRKLHIRRTEENSLKERNRMTFEIQEKERAKISRDIHDSVVQDIRVIRLETENLVVNEESKARQSKIEDIATDCIIKLRNICYNLTPAELTIHDKDGSSKFELISIINSLVQQFSSRTHFPCVFKVEEGFEYPVLEKDITQNLFRVIQEALTNIEKHSYATQASIFIKKEDENLLIYITDDGIGCDPDELQKKLKKREHLGLRSMMDRMELIGGSIEFFTAQDDGMEIKISLPVNNSFDNSESRK